MIKMIEHMLAYFYRPEDKKNLTAKWLPKKAVKVLRGTLEKLCAYVRQQNSDFEPSGNTEDAMMDFEKEFTRKRKEVDYML